MNDAGGMDGCAVFVVPRRHGRISEHGRGDQSYRNKLTHLHVSIDTVTERLTINSWPVRVNWTKGKRLFFVFSNPDFLLGAARPLPPSEDIGPGGQPNEFLEEQRRGHCPKGQFHHSSTAGIILTGTIR